MINAELRTTKTHLEMRYSKPNQLFGKDPFFPVSSEQEARRMLQFENRKYIIETMVAWLKQRQHALNSSSENANELINKLQFIRKASITCICKSIDEARKDFESLRPSETSTCFSYYQNAILPILDFCKP